VALVVFLRGVSRCDKVSSVSSALCTGPALRRPVTTRNWNTIATIARVLSNDLSD
jgi:hypothetical protein